MGETKAGYPLPAGRLEEALKDKKPLYTRGEALTEANRCIYCVDAPCVKACPTGIDIPTFIHKIATDNVRGAARTIFEDNLLGYSCARVCPVEVLCVGDCVYNGWGREPIQIGRLQRYATETALARDPALLSRTRKPKSGRRVALVGAGPASLAAAGHLALDGHHAVIFERKSIPGGLNALGIAPYKLQADDALDEIAFIEALGDVEIRTGTSVVAGEPKAGEVGVGSLLADYDAVFLGLGLGADNFLGVPGEDGPGVYGATALIERIKVDPSLSLAGLSRVAIVGGGNTAIDVARELALLGVPDVFMVYRKGAAAMPGYAHEMDGARREGVRLVEHRQPTEVVRDGERVVGLRVARTNGEGDEVLTCDAVVLAIGQARLTALAAAFEGVKLDERGRVLVDDDCRTGNPKVFAGGDCVNGGKEVVNAAQHGKLAARAMGRMFGRG
ncbi:MAG: FAD-dependent oxidoreductase [Myxococcales bacterium]|nr:FAD-dependent oxidoreductase [Myxococcales bacterium]